MVSQPLELWHCTVSRSILGPVVPSVRKHGRTSMLAKDAPDYVRQFLNLPENRHTRPVLGGFDAWDQVVALQPDPTAERDGGIVKVTPVRFPRTSQYPAHCMKVHISFMVKNPTWQPPRPRLTVREHGPLIRTFFQLLDYFGAEAPRSLNHRIYKDTECGASISILLEGPTAMGTWVHNGDKRWDTLTGDEKLRGFTIQTIVEGSEATVDSDLFYIPCTQAEVQTWIAEMEAQADDLWKAANGDGQEDTDE